MTGSQEFELITRAADSLQKARESARAFEVELADAQQALTALAALSLPSVPVPAPAPGVRTVIVNGRRLTENEAQAVDDNDYDVILDMTDATLRYRGSPEQHSKLRLANLQEAGPHRIRILAIMIERFGVPLWAEKADDLLGESPKVTQPEAFTKSISVLRRNLGGGGRGNPYIESVRAWQSPRSGNACAYQLNPKWKYLLIHA